MAKSWWQKLSFPGGI